MNWYILLASLAFAVAMILNSAVHYIALKAYDECRAKTKSETFAVVLLRILVVAMIYQGICVILTLAKHTQ